MPLNNAARQNYLQIREQQRLNRERSLEDEAMERRHQELVHRQKAAYEHVPSHGYGGINPHPITDDVEIKVFIRECESDRAQSFSFMESEAAAGQTASQAPQTERRASRGTGEPQPMVKPIPKSSNVLPSVPQRGVVPDYLRRRKAELAAEKETLRREAERLKEAEKYPPGHRPVTDAERKETLQKLAERRSELELELHKIPIRYDTQAIKMKRRKIEDELAEIEEAERKFNSKRQLFVPI